METIRIADDLIAFAHWEPVPKQGFFPCFSYLLLGDEPVLFDTGFARTAGEFVEALARVVDPRDLAAVVVSHADQDHAGALPALVEAAPRARLVVNPIASGKLRSVMAVPLGRLRWVSPGERVTLGRRAFRVLRPPMYDCPTTIALFEEKSRVLLASDGFGAYVPERTHALAQQALAPALEGMSYFCRANSPWIADVRPERYAAALKEMADLAPERLLAAHLPPANAAEAQALFARAARLPQEGSVPLPPQAALDALLASLPQAA